MVEQDIRVFNPNKEISKEITLEVLIRHRDAMKQARTGELVNTAVEELDDTTRKFNQVRALNLIIAAQREMICISRPIISFRSMEKFKKHKSKKGHENDKFEDFDCDYNKLVNEYLELLKACAADIAEAERTKTLDDDLIIEIQDYDGKIKYRITDNFYELLEELEKSYENIYLMMLLNKIVSSGLEQDEEKTYKEKEEEAIRRVVEA